MDITLIFFSPPIMGDVQIVVYIYIYLFIYGPFRFLLEQIASFPLFSVFYFLYFLIEL